jgi:hypothetical protein
VDAAIPPGGVLDGQAQDQGADTGRDGGSARASVRVVQRRLMRWRCQRRIVEGVASSPRRRRAGSSRTRAAIIARSVQLNRGRGVRRCSTPLLMPQDEDLNLVGRVGAGA